MGHTESIGTECHEVNPLLLALEERRSWRQLLPGRSTVLPDAVADAVLQRLAEGGDPAKPFTFGPTQLAEMGYALRTIQDQLQRFVAVWRLEALDHGTLGIPFALHVLVEGYQGGPQTEIQVWAQADWSKRELRVLTPSASPSKREVRVLNRGVRAFPAAKREVRALFSSTCTVSSETTSPQRQPSRLPPAAGGQAGLTEPQEALLGALLELECPPDLAEQAARVCPTTRRPERLGLLLPALEPLLASIAREPGVKSPHHVLAKRLRTGEAYGQALALQGRVRDLQPEAGKAPGLGATPSPRPSPLPPSAEALGAPSDAVAAYARLAEEVERLDPEVATSWYRPVALQQGVLTLDHAWFSAEHEDVFQRAATSLGLRLAVPGEPTSKKIG